MPFPAPNRFAILDCAVDPRLYEHAARLEPHSARCLFEGKLYPEVKMVSPHLVELTPNDPLTRLWCREGWGRAWGIWIDSRHDLRSVWRRMRHFTQARLPSGEGPLLFRFWDPRVFRVYLPLVEAAELPQWFEAVDAYIVEAQHDVDALVFSCAGESLIVKYFRNIPVDFAQKNQ